MSFLKVGIKDNFSSALMRKLQEAGPRAAHAVAIQIASDTEPFVPALNKSLVNRTRVIGSSVVYPGPYARYLYNGKVMVDAATGKGPMHFVDKYGNEVVLFPKGSTLKETDRNLVFTKSVHSQAQDHWSEASKAQNLDKWVRVAGKAVDSELSK